MHSWLESAFCYMSLSRTCCRHVTWISSLNFQNLAICVSRAACFIRLITVPLFSPAVRSTGRTSTARSRVASGTSPFTFSTGMSSEGTPVSVSRQLLLSIKKTSPLATGVTILKPRQNSVVWNPPHPPTLCFNCWALCPLSQSRHAETNLSAAAQCISVNTDKQVICCVGGHGKYTHHRFLLFLLKPPTVFRHCPVIGC